MVLGDLAIFFARIASRIVGFDLSSLFIILSVYRTLPCGRSQWSIATIKTTDRIIKHIIAQPSKSNPLCWVTQPTPLRRHHNYSVLGNQLRYLSNFLLPNTDLTEERKAHRLFRRLGLPTRIL